MDPQLVHLIAAAVTFVGSHFVLSHPLRQALHNVIGAKGFMAVYSLVALASFGWMIAAFRAAQGGNALWDGTANTPWALASALTLLAAVLLVGSFQGNPAMPDPRARDLVARGAHGVFRVTRHPMMWSFALWAAAHVAVAPTPRVLVLAGALGVLALVGAHLQDRKKEELMGADWEKWEAQTSYWPRLSGLARTGNLPRYGGLVLWLAATWGHIPLLYVPAGVWRWLVG